MRKQKDQLKLYTRVRIVSLPSSVSEEVRQYEGATGVIKSFGSPSSNGVKGFHIRMDDGRHSKRFYENELEPI